MRNHPKNPLVYRPFPVIYPDFWNPLDAKQVNTLFGFRYKVPIDFSGCITYKGHTIICLPSQPDRKHRMFTHCPLCNTCLTVGCLPQHMRYSHPF